MRGRTILNGSAGAVGLIGFFGVATCASAQTTPPTAAPSAGAEAQPTSPAPAPAPPSTPSMAGPLTVNPYPFNFEAGPLGKIYVTGVLSGLGQAQTNHVPGDHTTLGDISNGQIFIQKTDGVFQFFVQTGAYSLPALGAPYVHAGTVIPETYGAVPQAFIKIAPNSSFSIQVGKLPTLIGAEYTFTFENMNIERGLLWGQENAVNRGVQANYVSGKWGLSLSLNDGFYSSRYSWVTGSATYAFTSADSLIFAAGGNTKRTSYTSFATPGTLNNETIYDLIFTHTKNEWTFQPYLQYTHVPVVPSLGILHSGTTVGGAVLVKYSPPSSSPLSGWSFPVRVEYLSTSGNVADGSPNVLYGPGSDAWSITFTPTYQYKIYFVRAEISYADATRATAGSTFGLDGMARSQTRGLLEAGVLF